LHTIIFKHANGKTLPAYQYGYNVETIKAIKWNAPSVVFDTLLRKRSANHLSGQKLTRILKDLPDKADQIIDNTSHLMLVSTQTSATEMLLFWLETRTEFTENDYKNLKQIVSLISDNTQ